MFGPHASMMPDANWNKAYSCGWGVGQVIRSIGTEVSPGLNSMSSASSKSPANPFATNPQSKSGECRRREDRDLTVADV